MLTSSEKGMARSLLISKLAIDWISSSHAFTHLVYGLKQETMFKFINGQCPMTAQTLQHQVNGLLSWFAQLLRW